MSTPPTTTQHNTTYARTCGWLYCPHCRTRYPALEVALNRARQNDMVFIAAAGNYNSDNDVYAHLDAT